MKLFSVSRERRARRSDALALLLLLVLSAQVAYLVFAVLK